MSNIQITVLMFCISSVSLQLVKYTSSVKTSQGRVKGLTNINGQNQYLGIPYGRSERFQTPKPARKWRDVLDVIHAYDSCPQALSYFHFGKEDCLKLDIYTPGQIAKHQKLPVLVFFHGGAYFLGSKSHYNPEFLIEKNVIVVLVNYRLGVLGFLCLNNVANLGLKDQLLALKWIQKNIAAFGGDPDNVTVCGQSAGAASSSMHILSKRSKGLFHKAIVMSGSAFTPWAFNHEPLTSAFEDGAKMRSIQNESDVYNTFVKAPLDDLLSATVDDLQDSKNLKYFKYTPCGDANFSDPFFHDTPYNIIKSGDFNKVPMIIGFTNLEGIFFYSMSKRSLEKTDDIFAERLPSIFSWCSHGDKKQIADKIRCNYFKNKKNNRRASDKGGINLYSDWLAHAVTEPFSKLMAAHSDKPVYNYMFSYEGGRNFFKRISNRRFNMKGAAHSDDLFYSFKPKLGFLFGMSDSNKMVIESFTTMLTNFMKYGDPTPTTTNLLPIRWPVTTPNSSLIMRIDQPLSVTTMPHHVKGQFFRELMCEYGLQGYVPCDSAMKCNLDKQRSR